MYGVKSIEADWIKLAPQLFIDYGNPWVDRPTKCEFLNKKGKRQIETLDWQKIQYTDAKMMWNRAAFGEAPLVGITDHDDLVWISIPTFSPKKLDSKQLKRIVDSVNKYRSKSKVVFDVRGNTGGNSQWGEDIVRNLFGNGYVDYLRSRGRSIETKVEWRISKGNSEYLNDVTPRLKNEFGDDSEIYKVFAAVGEKMTQAVKEGRNDLLLQPEILTGEESGIPSTSVESPVQAKVFLLTDGRCASACLDFADAMLEIPEVVHVGLPTSADTVYMDIRGVDLPSGVMRLGFAMKVYRGRMRGHNEFFTPKLRYRGDIGDTEALKAWIKKTND